MQRGIGDVGDVSNEGQTVAARAAFTRRGALIGARRVLPLAAGVFVYGLVFGLLARQAGLSAVEALLMSALVFAGASQLVAVGLWATPLPLGAIVLATLVVNLRYLLMGAALRPLLGRLRPFVAYGSVFFMADENWALTTGEMAAGRDDGAFLLGSGLALYASWLGATALGYTAGSRLGDPARWGLDFVFTAAFLSLLVGMWRGKRDLLPWCAAAVVATVVWRLVPGEWYIIAGAATGAIVGVWRYAD